MYNTIFTVHVSKLSYSKCMPWSPDPSYKVVGFCEVSSREFSSYMGYQGSSDYHSPTLQLSALKFPFCLGQELCDDLCGEAKTKHIRLSRTTTEKIQRVLRYTVNGRDSESGRDNSIQNNNNNLYIQVCLESTFIQAITAGWHNYCHYFNSHIRAFDTNSKCNN